MKDMGLWVPKIYVMMLLGVKSTVLEAQSVNGRRHLSFQAGLKLQGAPEGQC